MSGGLKYYDRLHYAGRMIKLTYKIAQTSKLVRSSEPASSQRRVQCSNTTLPCHSSLNVSAITNDNACIDDISELAMKVILQKDILVRLSKAVLRVTGNCHVSNVEPSTGEYCSV